ncbi:MAG: hypothetical protein ABSB74_10645, partial [Tepidisphaeraceae bacterium]
PPGSLQVPGDDHTAEEQRYQAELQARVDGLVRDAASADAAAVAASERKLPTAALPLLQAAITSGNLPSATTRPIGEALGQDAVRLGNALWTQQRMAWYRSHLLDVSEKISDKKPWAAPSRAVVQAAVRLWSNDPRSSGDEDSIIWREANPACKANCTDPLMWLAWGQNLMRWNDTDRGWTAEVATTAQEHMKESDYPLSFKMAADFWAAKAIALNTPVSNANKKKRDQLVDQGKALFAKVIADRDLPRQQIFFLFEVMEGVSPAVYGDRRTLPAALFDELKKSSVDPSVALEVQGKFNTEYAWDARGGGWADSVTQQGWQLFGQRLAKAADALEQAWKLDPTNSDTAASMIDVELGQGQGRDRMELWFSRAMQADPDNYWACSQKLYYLEPKWYGSNEEMLKFGRECLAGGNWDAGIPYILVEAHLRASHYTDGGWQRSEQKAYFDNNPQAWDEISSVYAQYRLHRPRSVGIELEMARVASWSGHWNEANQLFNEVGDAYDTNVYSVEEQKRAREIARRHASASSQPSKF